MGRGSPIVTVIVWLVYFGLTAGVIMVDGRLQRAKAEREGGVDFMDRSPLPYLLTGVICGPLPLIFYFGATRKSALGYLLGVGAAIGVLIMTVIASVIANVAFAVAG